MEIFILKPCRKINIHIILVMEFIHVAVVESVFTLLGSCVLALWLSLPWPCAAAPIRRWSLLNDKSILSGFGNLPCSVFTAVPLFSL